MSDLKAVVLRKPASDDGDFEFRIAKVQPEMAAQLEEQLSSGTLDSEAIRAFGPAMNLSQAMHRLDTRDFSVFDLPPAR